MSSKVQGLPAWTALEVLSHLIPKTSLTHCYLFPSDLSLGLPYHLLSRVNLQSSHMQRSLTSLKLYFLLLYLWYFLVTGCKHRLGDEYSPVKCVLTISPGSNLRWSP
jgi:hypothetical protein